MKSVCALLALLYTTAAFALPTFNPQLILVNPQGEKTPYGIVYPGTNFIGGKIAANSVVSNITGSTAYPVANTYAAVSAKLTPAMLLTGFVAGAGTVAATDTVLQGFNKLAGNQPVVVECAASAGGAATEVLVCTGLAASDVILAVTQRVPGANSLPLLGYSTLATNAITGVWSANPGAGAIVRVTVKH